MTYMHHYMNRHTNRTNPKVHGNFDVNEASMRVDCLKHCCYLTSASIRLTCTYSHTSGSPRAKKEIIGTSALYISHAHFAI